VAPAGDHTITLVFQPSSLRWGALISLITLIGLAILWFLPDRKD